MKLGQSSDTVLAEFVLCGGGSDLIGSGYQSVNEWYQTRLATVEVQKDILTKLGDHGTSSSCEEAGKIARRSMLNDCSQELVSCCLTTLHIMATCCC